MPPDNSGLLAKRGADLPHWDEAMAILNEKCVHCHAADANLPFYASLPVASTLMEIDITKGRAGMDLKKELYGCPSAMADGGEKR
ncbi:heme-binding domain-containing protein [Myxococcota bacterium]|nr:heme-binding domain-containing protein [Myxococcota bacterium]